MCTKHHTNHNISWHFTFINSQITIFDVADIYIYIYTHKRLHVAVDLYSSSTQKVSQCWKNIRDTVVSLLSLVTILTSSTMYCWTNAQQHGIHKIIMLLILQLYYLANPYFYISTKIYFYHIVKIEIDLSTKLYTQARGKKRVDPLRAFLKAQLESFQDITVLTALRISWVWIVL